MSSHNDFVDEFLEFQIFEDSMKNSCVSNSHKPKKSFGCVTGAVVIILVILVLSVFGSCSKGNQKLYSSSSYRSSYSTSVISYPDSFSKPGNSSSACEKTMSASAVQTTTQKNTYKSKYPKSR